MSLELIATVCLAALLAGFLQSFTGFGAVLLSLSLLALFMDIKIVIPLCGIIGLLVTVFVFWQMRASLRWQEVWPLVLAALPGILVGGFLAKYLDQGILAWLLGACLISFALFRLCFFRTDLFLRAPLWPYAFGLLAGFLGGSISASGPPVIVYTSLKEWSKDRMKATLQGFFLIANAGIVAIHASLGLTTGRVLLFTGAALPSMAAGVWLGSFFYGRMAEKYYRVAILTALGLMGVMIIVKH